MQIKSHRSEQQTLHLVSGLHFQDFCCLRNNQYIIGLSYEQMQAKYFRNDLPFLASQFQRFPMTRAVVPHHEHLELVSGPHSIVSFSQQLVGGVAFSVSLQLLGGSSSNNGRGFRHLQTSPYKHTGKGRINHHFA